ncbi:MAG: hypothetical protein JXA11_02000, partial [Phycisphaerae bacterium]|nr:hypothetical protein [Phycisphaerae bacterium]
MMNQADLLPRYQETVRTASAWLAEQQQVDGSFAGREDLSNYYKAVYCHAVSGHALQAGRVAEYVKKHFLQPNGDFRTSPETKGWPHLAWSPLCHYIYANGWLVSGCVRAGRYDLAQAGAGFIESMFCEEHGGAWAYWENGRVVRKMMDTSSTSSGGLAMLACGRIERAIKAGDFLLRLIDAQPQPDKYFFVNWLAEGRLHTDVFGNEDPHAEDGRKQHCLSAEHDAAGEMTWLVGKPMKFLAKLYDATGEKRFLDGADQLARFFQKLSPSRWENYGSCKIMWATAELYRHTGRQEYYDICTKIADFIADTQLSWGGWVHTLWYDNDDAQPMEMSSDITQEFVAE